MVFTSTVYAFRDKWVDTHIFADRQTDRQTDRQKASVYHIDLNTLMCSHLKNTFLSHHISLSFKLTKQS